MMWLTPLVFVSINWSIVIAVLVDHFDMEYFYQKDPIFDTSLVQDDSLLTADCSDQKGTVWYNSVYSYERIFYCTIVLQNIYFDLKKSKVRKCTMKMQELAMFHPSLGHLDKNTFVLKYFRWDFDGHRYMQVFLGQIDDKKDCKIVKKLGFREDHFQGDVLTHQDSFDVVTTASKICGDVEVCIATYDKNGRKLDRTIPIPYNREFESNVIRMQEPDAQNYFITQTDTKDDPTYRLNLISVDTSGATKSLMNLSTEDSYLVHQSDNNRKFILCVKYVHNHVCDQFDEKAERKVHQFIEFAPYHGIAVLHNLAKDGFILAHGTCVKRSKVLDCDDWKITRYRENGEIEYLDKTVKSSLTCNADKTGFYPYAIEDGSSICFYIICLYNDFNARKGRDSAGIIRTNARMFCTNKTSMINF